MENRTKSSGVYPWYVHLVGGWSLGGFFPWLLVIRKALKSNRKVMALVLSAVTLVIYLALALCGFFLKVPWDMLSLFAIVFGVIWSLSAWLFQYRFFGPAPRRYFPAEWRKWLKPLATAVLFGAGLSVIYSVFPMISNRFQMYQANDILSKELILWDFFRYIPYSLLISVPVGMWWAGERKNFSIAHVLSYIFALPLFYLLLVGASALFFFLFNRGNMVPSAFFWPVLPHELHEGQKVLVALMEKDYSALFVMPLLLGFTPRIRDFFRRALLYFPFFIILFLGLFGFSNQFWQYIQRGIVYATSSQDQAQRERAFRQVNLLLIRYPQHQGWPVLGLEVARHKYLQGDREGARKMYGAVLEKATKSRRWDKEAKLASNILASQKFGEFALRKKITLPAISYESYMTSNWMSLIRLLRYYEQDTRSESQTLIRLKRLSTSDSEIKLSPMPTLAELDDNASSLGYDVLFLPADLKVIRTLLGAGYPVLLPIKDSFNLLYGVDEGRAVVEAACYRDSLPVASKIKSAELGRTVLEQDGRQAVSSSWNRLNDLAVKELPFSFWQGPGRRYAAPFAAVVVPPDRKNEAVALLGDDQQVLTRSDAILDGLIALNSMKNGNVMEAISWAQKSAQLQNDPFPLHVAHLAVLLWRSRDTMILTRLGLSEKFPQLEAIGQAMAETERRKFLDKADHRFQEDFQGKALSWLVLDQYEDFLDRSQLKERGELIAVHQQAVEFEPSSRGDWLSLAQLREWNRDVVGAAEAYRGALDSAAWDDALAVRLCTRLLKSGQVDSSASLIDKISASAVRFDPDYYYCRAAVADAQGDGDAARADYEKAIGMRKYNPEYHRSYAAFLQSRGEDPERVARLMAWAAKLAAKSKRDTSGEASLELHK